MVAGITFLLEYWLLHGIVCATSVMVGMPLSMNDHRPLRGRAADLRLALLAAFGCLIFLFLASGCDTPSVVPSRRFSEILYRYPQAQEPLRIPRLTVSAAESLSPSAHGKAVTIIVHPAYSLFFREEHEGAYTEAKYGLLKFQLDNEAQFIRELSKTDNVMILVLPGNYEKDSIAPLSFTFYLNSAAGSGTTVYYISSESSSTGTLPMDAMVNLYGFLQKIKAGKVLIGGGYIGRCQREFYQQFSAYIDGVPAFIVPEISSISPDDISDKDALAILGSLQQRDYTPVKLYIERKGHGSTNELPFPAQPGL
jgi:hypothetical protein